MPLLALHRCAASTTATAAARKKHQTQNSAAHWAGLTPSPPTRWRSRWHGSLHLEVSESTDRRDASARPTVGVDAALACRKAVGGSKKMRNQLHGHAEPVDDAVAHLEVAADDELGAGGGARA